MRLTPRYFAIFLFVSLLILGLCSFSLGLGDGSYRWYLIQAAIAAVMVLQVWMLLVKVLTILRKPIEMNQARIETMIVDLASMKNDLIALRSNFSGSASNGLKATIFTELSADSNESQDQTSELGKLHPLIVSLCDTTDGLESQVAHAHRMVLGLEKLRTAFSSISNQVDIVAVNSALEASKAGEEGRRMVHVAQDIRALIQDARQTIEQMGGSVANILSASDGLSTELKTANELASSALEYSAQLASDELVKATGSDTDETDCLSIVTQESSVAQHGSADMSRFVQELDYTAQTLTGLHDELSLLLHKKAGGENSV